MPARTGAQYIAGLRERAADIYIGGEKVADVTRHSAFAGGLQTVAGLLDMQHDPAIRDEMTYASPSSGDPVGLSFIMPRNGDDLKRRRKMMRNWAKFSCGMMGRTPDFLNVAVMSMAAAADYSGLNRPQFRQNILDYYEYIRENDIVMTHTLVNLQRSRSVGATPFDDRTEVALSVVDENADGIVVRGARVLATLGPLSDEIAVYPARTRRVPAGDEGKYAFGFAIPCNTQGLKFQCRDTIDLGRSHFDHPAGSRFEEMDAIVFFDDVLVPWQRVFLYNDVELCNRWGERTNRNAHTGHQVVTKNVVKCEFMLGLATLMSETLGSGELPPTQHLIAELIENLEITKALLAASEAQAELDEWGIFCPDYRPLLVARKQMITMYPRMAEILHLLGSSSLMALPAEADLNGPLAEDIHRYMDTDTATAEERIRLFRLAWDVSCSAFGGRQTLYERYFGGDAARNAALLYQTYDRTAQRNLVQEFLSLE
ncbi:MAG: 4-hydroxyphenylacetate 3-monooxygenase, oxygenase component [Chloroflexi bacterium]|nr:4-hydroxyphenylacetate 3-monooxygenase, oxygenase component [Chloroflexota bacterium]MYD48821.1 4-hydroxyphenylacetate 3-monooxygenase, oxygenase component [Chloroflexota bacterium]